MVVLGLLVVGLFFSLAFIFSAGAVLYLPMAYLALNHPRLVNNERYVATSLCLASAAICTLVAYFVVPHSLWIYNFLLVNEIAALPSAFIKSFS